MTQFDRFERELPVALGDVAGTGAPDYLTDILGRTARTRQRPAWASLERWLPMDLATPRAATARVPWRTLGVLALIALLLATAFALYAGTQRRVPAPFGPAANGLIPYSFDGNILVGDPVTGATRLLVGGPDNDYGPSFSPDGTQVGFLRATADCPQPGDVCPGGEHVVVVGADGRDVRAISSAPLVGIAIVTWAPDSRGLLVAHDVGGRQRLEVFDTGGTQPPRLLLEDASADWALYRPPAGAEILFRGRIDGTWGLYRMQADGTGIQLLAPAKTTGSPDQDLNFPAYSPDGSTIYYNRYTPEAETIQAWAMNADGSNQHRFNASGPASGWWEGEMVPSPDGKSVAMWRVPPSGHGLITVFPADGSGDGRAIGPDVAGTGHWWWAPDSTKLLLNYNDSAEGDQSLIDVDSGGSTQLPWNADTEPDWQRLAP